MVLSPIAIVVDDSLRGGISLLAGKRMRWVILMFVAGLAASPAIGRSADSANPLDELRWRLDALERENWDLRRSVERTRLGTLESDGRVRSIVEDYLAERGGQLEAPKAAVRAAPKFVGSEEMGTVVGQDLTMTA